MMLLLLVVVVTAFSATPAFAQATLIDRCQPSGADELCFHRVLTPSGNINLGRTFTDPTTGEFATDTVHLHPGQNPPDPLDLPSGSFVTPSEAHSPGPPE